MNASRRIIYEFGQFRIDAVRRLLAYSGAPVSLTPKNFDLLLTLVQQRGHVLTKEELLCTLWPRTAVEESNLTQNIFVLRKILGETTNNHRYIVTVPGQGYRFVAPVREYEEYPRPDWAEEAADIDNQTVTMAVLPFNNIDPRAEDEYWGPGLASSLINRLNRLGPVMVQPTSAVLKYSDASFSPQAAGQELSVSVVLAGTIQRASENIRVNVELIRVRDGASLWAEQFNNSFTDIFSTQDAISAQVMQALQVELTGEERHRLISK